MPTTSRRNRRRAWTIASFVATFGLIAVTASAAHSFLDVPDNHTFHGDIEWMKDTGITRGCNPPENTRYCPNDFTTRGEMAAFFHRFANAGVVDATTLEGEPASAYLAVNDTAADSALLGGHPPSAYLGVNDTAADSDQLGGVDADQYVKVGDDLGAALAGSIYIAEDTETWLLAVNNEVVASCDSGDVLIGGGYEADGLLEANVFSSHPDGEDWVVQGTVSLQGDVTAYAICVSS